MLCLLVPNLEALEPQPARQAELARALLEGLQRVSPLVEEVEPGRLLADVVGLEAYYGGAGALGRAVLAETGEVAAAQVGVAPTRFGAELAAQAAQPGGCLVVEAAKELGFLAAQPVGSAPLTAETLRRLQLLDLRRLGQIAALPRSALLAQFGGEGGWLWDAANGRDGRALRPAPLRQPLRETLQAEPPLIGLDGVAHGVRQLLTRVTRREELANRAVAALRLRLYYEQRECWEREHVCREPSASPERLWRMLDHVLERAQLAGPVAQIELTVLAMRPLGGDQAPLFPGRAQVRRRLERMARELEVRYQRTPIQQIVEVEPWHRLPERRYGLVDYEP